MENTYKTTDLNLACYLEEIKGFKCDLRRGKGNAIFLFGDEVKQEYIDKFYENEGNFLHYANAIRNMKSRIKNQKERVDING